MLDDCAWPATATAPTITTATAADLMKLETMKQSLRT
jgi:hypothetical protein